LSHNVRHFYKLPFFSNFSKFATGAIGSPSLFLRIGPASNCNSSLGTNDKWNAELTEPNGAVLSVGSIVILCYYTIKVSPNWSKT